jgi:2'-5' RNA ligase
VPDIERRQQTSAAEQSSPAEPGNCDPAHGQDGDPEAEWSDYLAVGTMRSHWDRPWPAGERAYYWYLTFGHVPAVVDLAMQVWDAIARPELDRVPPTDLHMTLQRVATVGEITDDELTAVRDRTRKLCAGLAPFQLTIGPVTGSAGAIRFTVRPWAPIVELRRQLRAALTDVLGADRVASPEGDFRPHIGVAYANAALPVDQLAAPMTDLRQLPPATAVVDRIQLVDLGRTDHAYAIQPAGSLSLDASASTAE